MARPITELRQQLVTELKIAYQTRCRDIRPIPKLKVQTLSVNNVFIEGRLECLVEDSEDIYRWESLETYKHLRSDPRIKSNRRIIEAEPGCGKSVLTLQLANDWSADGQAAFLSDVQILIVLQLRQLRDITSIYECIKQFILLKDSNLEIDDIKRILRQTSSVLFVLDGVDEYPAYDIKVKNDILAIMKNEMFPHFEVVLTTRTPYISKKFSPDPKRIRLTGFDSLAQDKYLRKVVTKDDAAAATRIKESLQDNPTLGDLCRVPFFFATYAHMIYDNDTQQRYTTITGYFREMVSCFHDHFIRKMDDQNFQTVADVTDNHILNKAAYESLLGYTEHVWNIDYLCDLLGEDVYNQYLSIGIFRELFEQEEGSVTGDAPIKVSFNHSLFCEWYAAHYLVDVIVNHDSDPEDFEDEYILEIIDDLYPYRFQNLYRFACGINPDAAKRIIQYIRDIEGNDQFAILCILEQCETNHDVFDALRELCSDTLHISHADTKLWQKSILQIITTAYRHQIKISSIMLHGAIQSVAISGDEIILTSGLFISTKNTLEHLWMEMIGVDWDEDTLQSIFKYASKCKHLTALSFANFVIPGRFEDLSVLSKLHEKHVEVRWYPTLICYRLNLQNGNWENPSTRTPLSKEDVEKAVTLCKSVNQ